MKCNVGNADKIFGIILGIAIIDLGLYSSNWWGLAGLIPPATAQIGRCGLYIPLGISTGREL
jgi:hypothetical protein